MIEDIPEISNAVAKEAGKIVSFALINEIDIDSVEPNVLGGVAIYLSNKSCIGYNEKAIWVSLLNNGAKTIVLLDEKSKNLIAKNFDYNLIMELLFSEPE